VAMILAENVATPESAHFRNFPNTTFGRSRKALAYINDAKQRRMPKLPSNQGCGGMMFRRNDIPSEHHSVFCGMSFRSEHHSAKKRNDIPFLCENGMTFRFSGMTFRRNIIPFFRNDVPNGTSFRKNGISFRKNGMSFRKNGMSFRSEHHSDGTSFRRNIIPTENHSDGTSFRRNIIPRRNVIPLPTRYFTGHNAVPFGINTPFRLVLTQ